MDQKSVSRRVATGTLIATVATFPAILRALRNGYEVEVPTSPPDPGFLPMRYPGGSRTIVVDGYSLTVDYPSMELCSPEDLERLYSNVRQATQDALARDPGYADHMAKRHQEILAEARRRAIERLEETTADHLRKLEANADLNEHAKAQIRAAIIDQRDKMKARIESDEWGDSPGGLSDERRQALSQSLNDSVQRNVATTLEEALARSGLTDQQKNQIIEQAAAQAGAHATRWLLD